ncbi:MAG TPA: peptidoglycan bridge formation glycyltransferase FemA/FemB family protein [Verrucomicrobiae bacterium]|nr:peptidoglycan bridge formation glycyltransferase FemA/FemB family protein [Verrucomicrobiae bacterium]
MKMTEGRDQKTWDAFVSALPYAQFTQSWAWGELQRSLGRQPRRFLLGNAACQLIHMPRFGVSGYWLAPRGPVFASTLTKEGQAEVLSALAELALPRSLFTRVEPLAKKGSLDMDGRFIAHRFYNPSTTALLDLTKSEEALLAAMHQKTRYNIRVAQKHGVTVRVGTEQDLASFIRLSHETSERDRFLHMSETYLRKTYEILSKAGMARLRLAEYNGTLLAANMEIHFGDTMTYLHGASSSEMRNMMAPFILHWDAIRFAKEEGFKIYDFWGCNPESEQAFDFRPRWEGITRFKLGWGSERVSYVGTFDIAKQPMVYRLLRKIGRV